MVIVHCYAVGVLLSGALATDDYPVVDATIPAFVAEAAASYADDIPIVQDSIAQPWDAVLPVSGPRCCDGLAVPDGW